MIIWFFLYEYRYKYVYVDPLDIVSLIGIELYIGMGNKQTTTKKWYEEWEQK